MSEMNHIKNNLQQSATAPARTSFRDELRIVPWWAVLLGGIGFIGMQYLMNVVLPAQPDAPPMAARVLLGILSGLLVICFFALLGYVNADARRRGMNVWLWTVLVICIPNAFGFIIYFLVRQPMMTTCPQCGATLQPHFRFCPKCSAPRTAVCGHCAAPVQPGDQFCNNCGRMLAEPLK
jgi:Double zinc ribbon